MELYFATEEGGWGLIFVIFYIKIKIRIKRNDKYIVKAVKRLGRENSNVNDVISLLSTV